MRFLLLLALFGVSLEAQTLRALNTGATPPSATISTASGSQTASFRFHTIDGTDFVSPGGSNVDIWALSTGSVQVHCYFVASTTHMQCYDVNDAPVLGFTEVDLSGRHDIRGVMQRFSSLPSGTLQIDIWNGDCTNHASNVKPNLNNVAEPANYTSMAVGGGSGNISIDFARADPGLTGPTPSCPTDAPTAAASNFDWRFEGDTRTDVSGHSYALSVSGSTFANSPAYPPLAVISGWSSAVPVFRAATQTGFVLSSANSVTFTGNGTPASVFWTAVGAPGPIAFSSRTTTSTTITATLASPYTIRLQVVDDNGTSAITDQVVGVVATDNSGVVLTGNPRMDIALGPIIQHGTEEWPWYGWTEKGYADSLSTLMTVGPTEPANESGTVTVTDPTGCCPWAPVGTGTNFLTSLASAAPVWIKWDKDNNGTYLGRKYAITLAPPIDNTHVNINGDFNYSRPFPLSIGVPYSKPSGSELFNYTASGQPSNSIDYYGVGQGMYRFAFATNSPIYRAQIRAFCPLWMVYGLDWGYNITAPRNEGLLSMVACAVDQYPEFWDLITRNLERLGTLYLLNPSAPVLRFPQTVDAREQAYVGRYTIKNARLNPDGPTRNTYCGYARAQIENIWKPWQTALGYWEEDVFAQNPSVPAAPIAGVYGTAPWRGGGIPALFLQEAYDAFIETSSTGCNDPTYAATLMPYILKVANFMYDYGRSPTGGVWGEVLYFTNSSVGSAPTYTTTATFINGSTHVVGTGTHFLTQILACNGTGWIGAYYGFTDARNFVGRVIACTSDTDITLDAPFSGATGAPVIWTSTTTATTNCSPSIASHCTPLSGDTTGGLDVGQDSAAIMQWLYYRTGDATWKAKGDLFAAAMYGGPAGGPGTFGPCGGTGCTGQHNGFDLGTPACGTPPCGGIGAAAIGKNFGTNTGAPGAPNAFAWRLGGVLPAVPRTYTINVKVDSVTGATNILATLTKPDGTTTTTTCTLAQVNAGTCTITADMRMGNSLLRVDYRDGSNNVLAAGGNVVVRQ